MAWVNVPDLTSTPDTIISMNYGNVTMSTRQHAEEVFSRSDLLYGTGDLRGVVDVGMVIQKDLA